MKKTNKDPLTHDIDSRLKKEHFDQPVPDKDKKIDYQFWLTLIIAIVMVAGTVISFIKLF